MPADTPVVGYPAHAVDTYTWDVNDYGTRRVGWVAQCGAAGYEIGGRFLTAGSCRRLELCTACFPGRDRNACRLEKPRDLTLPD